MTKYSAYFTQCPSPRLRQPLNITMVDPSSNLTRNVMVSGLYDRPGSKGEIIGLQYQCRLDMKDMDMALGLSMQDSQFIGSAISLLTGVSAAPIMPYVIFTADEPLSSHRLRQFVPLPTPLWGIGEVAPDDLKRVILGAGTIQDASIADRLSSSMDFYRRAISTKDPIERFLHLWIALEYLDYSLSKMRPSLPGRKCSVCKSLLACPNCGTPAGPSLIAGLESHFVDNNRRDLADALNDAYDLRNRLFHRETDLSKGSRDADIANSSMKELYSRIMRHLLSLEDDVDFKNQFIHSIDSRVVIDATINLRIPSRLAMNDSSVPHFNLDISQLHETTKNDGKRSAEFKGTVSLEGVAEGAIWDITAMEMQTSGLTPAAIKFDDTP